jgi:CRP-like cAMP-binding protein
LKAANTLRRLDLFSALTDDEVEHLSHDVHYAPFAQGETITRQGAVAHFLYILHRGRVDVRLSQEAGETSVSTLEAPGFFGEMGLMTGEPRQASVIALSDVICYRLERDAFDQILQNRPEIAAGVSAVLAERKVQLEEVRAGLDAAGRTALRASERERILRNIRSFFGL